MTAELFRQLNLLRDQLRSLAPVRAGLLAFDGLPVMDYGFFPGGNGLYDGPHAAGTLQRSTLVLGSNFGCEDGFLSPEDRTLRCNDERTNDTWRPLLQLLADAGIDKRQCFFTNAIPYLHEGTSNLGDPCAWLKKTDLQRECVKFLEETLKAARPNLIVALGTAPAFLLSKLWPNDLRSWQDASIAGLDELPMAKVAGPGFSGICVAVTHPSMPNSWRRKMHKTRELEALLVSEAREAAGMTLWRPVE